MDDFLTRLFEWTGSLGRDAYSLVPLFVVILGLILVGRLLQRQSQRASGLRFRNQLIMVATSFVGALVVIVVLPVDAGVRGQLLTLVGIITSVTISLSSTTFLGNAMAGIMLKSVRNFRLGDFIQVGEHFGRVTERGLFHTEIQTADRDLTTLPNLYLATTPTKVTRASGTIVDATVSLGYDVPRAKIEERLLAAARQTELAEPFVQVLDLGDYSVTYRVAGLLEDSKRLLTYRSRLRGAMLDSLHGGGIEIVSPSFMNVRDFAPDHGFVPRRSAKVPVMTDPPVEVIFDKAEDAASLSALRADLTALEAQAEAVRKESKEAPDTDAKRQCETKLKQAEADITQLRADIAAAEEREKLKDD